jgi:hypothetical protein
MDVRASVMSCEAPVLLKTGRRFACGRCEVCLARSQRELVGRMDREFCSMPRGTHACMGTLTYNDAAIVEAWRDWGRAHWRLFSHALDGRVQGLKLFAVPELGSVHGRLHLHFVAFGVPEELCRVRYVSRSGKLVETCGFDELVRELWPHGFVRAQVARSVAGARYVAKYVTKGRALHLGRLADYRKLSARIRAVGGTPPSFADRWWIAWPRGRRGGLARRFAERLAVVAAVHPDVRANVDVPPHLLGAGGRRVMLSRYERRVARAALALDNPAAVRNREARNPEVAEMAARVAAAGSVLMLRLMQGHVDADAASVALARVRTRRSLGRL